MRKDKVTGINFEHNNSRLNIFYYGQTSVRRSTVSDDVSVDRAVNNNNNVANKPIIHVTKTTLNKNAVKFTSNIMTEVIKRDYDRGYKSKYDLQSSLKQGHKEFVSNSNFIYQKKEIINCLKECSTLVIRIPEYKSTGWVAVATLALHTFKDIDVMFVGSIDRLKYTSVLLLDENYETFENIEDCFKRIVQKQESLNG